MSRNRRAFTAALLLTATLLGNAGGCLLPHRVEVSNDGTPRYEQIHISYRVPGTHRVFALNDLEQDGIVQMSRDEEAKAAFGRVATLTIEFPHPDGLQGMASATLRVGDVKEGEPSESMLSRWKANLSWMPGSTVDGRVRQSSRDEVYAIDFPRQQLDLMLFDLAGCGFFDDQQRQGGMAHLSISVDRGRHSKVWSSEPRLDDVIARVLSEGRKTSP